MDFNNWIINHGTSKHTNEPTYMLASDMSDISDDDEPCSKSCEPCSYENQVKDIHFCKLKRHIADESSASDDENPPKKRKLTLCNICKESPAIETTDFPTNESAKNIVSYYKSLLGEADRTKFTSLIDKSDAESEIKSVLNYNVIDLEIEPNTVEIECESIRTVKCLTHNKLGLMIDLGPITEECSKISINDESHVQESLNKQKVSYFFPKLLSKIALQSKSDSSVKDSLQSKHSIFILCCKAKLALKFNNMDASALFKLTAMEVERGNFNQAFIYYKNAVLSLSNMIFQDKMFPFLSESELIEDNELSQNYENYFLYDQINMALINDDCIMTFMFEEDNCTKLSETEIDVKEAKKSIHCISRNDLKNYITLYKH